MNFENFQPKIIDFLGRKIFYSPKNRFFGKKSSKNVKMLKWHFWADCAFCKRDMAISKFWPIFDPPQSRHIGHFQHPHRVFWAIWTRWARKSALEALKPLSLAWNDFWPPKKHVPGLYLPWKSLSEFIGFLTRKPQIFRKKDFKLSKFKIYLAYTKS